ncbi:DUF2339 domain-containing protein [Oceanospirillum sp.]|uniref:DUF2339 domain-containing protein n=1 Tax=Oceanospirillum sp. TaxID=2021254 RepID=UPI003A91363B
MDEALLIALLFIVPIAGLVMAALGMVAFFRTQHQRDELKRLRDELGEYRQVLKHFDTVLKDQNLNQQQLSEQLDQAVGQMPEQPTAPPVSQQAIADTEIVPAQNHAVDQTLQPSAPGTEASPPPIPDQGSEEADVPWFDRLKKSVQQHWMIWLGGICVGLAGVFMVGYSIEQGILGPMARIVLSLLVGLALHGLAEYLHRTRGQNTIFASLAGGASIILYSALFATFRLFPDVSPLLVFAGMALTSFATMALALRQGPVLAALGMLGGYIVPLLINTGSGEIELALVYSTILTFFSLWLISYVERRWLWIGVIVGSLLWWLASLAATPMEGARSLYLLVIAYLFLAVPRFDWTLKQIDWPEDHQSTVKDLWQWLKNLKDAEFRRSQLNKLRQSTAWFQGILLLLATLAQAWSLWIEGVADASPISLLLLPALLILVAAQRPLFTLLPVIALVTTILAALLPLLTELHDQAVLETVSYGVQYGLIVRFILLSLLFSGTAIWLLRQRYPLPAYWAGMGALTPIALLSTAYYALNSFTDEWVWGSVAVAVSIAYLLLMRWAVNRNQPYYSDAFKVVITASAHLSLALLAVIWLADATLTVALAAQLVSLSWLQRRYQLTYMPWVIRVVLSVVVLRLTLNPWLLTYSNDSHWSLWTYGGSTLFAALAAWLMQSDIKMRAWLQGATAHLLILTIAAELRYWLYDGDIFISEYSFLEASLNTLIWGGAAAVYLYRARTGQHLTRLYEVLAGVHLTAAIVNYGVFVLLAGNPLWSDAADISTDPIFNLLLLSYGVPTLVGLALWRLLPVRFARFAILFAGANLLLFVSMEVRHLWQTGEMHLYRDTSNGELYTYSVVWLLMASAALLIGSWRQQLSLYKAGMGLLLVVVAKLFLVDMSDLTGLWRVASFMGLGLALLALAWLHQRLNHRMITDQQP